VNALRPVSTEPLVLSLGDWRDRDGVTFAAAVQVDPRLFAWLVNGAARRSSKTYQINEGNPPVKVTLVVV
jgi:hypothetical protein